MYEMEEKRKMKRIKRLIAMFMVAFTIVALVPAVSGNKKVEAAASAYQTSATTTSVTFKWVKYTGSRTVTAYYIGYADAELDNSSSIAMDMARSKKISVSATTTAYTLKNLKAGKKYDVVVFYGYNDSYGAQTGYHYSCYCKTLYNKVTGFNLSDYYLPASETGKASFKVEWLPKKYADGYQFVVYSNGGTQIASKFCSYNYATFDEAKYNASYRVRVRSYIDCNGTKKYSAWSSYYYIVMQPKITSAVINSKGALAIKWDKVTGADSYEVYISTEGGRLGFKKVATVTGTAKTVATFNSKKFSKTGTYYVVVRAVKKVGSTLKYYSGSDYVLKVSPY